ncbi:MAG: hypothetical protein H0T79_21505 [Deltaproteobacteria bacterium]|nr:hypothetical protein [Deltaproteobacteria bacterium]
MSLDEVRQRALDRLAVPYDKAVAASHDPYWNHGRGNVQTWVAHAFHAAIDQVTRHVAFSTESDRVYLARLAGLVRELRGHGPDADDESWFDSAIDEAASIIETAS